MYKVQCLAEQAYIIVLSLEEQPKRSCSTNELPQIFSWQNVTRRVMDKCTRPRFLKIVLLYKRLFRTFLELKKNKIKFKKNKKIQQILFKYVGAYFTNHIWKFVKKLGDSWLILYFQIIIMDILQASSLHSVQRLNFWK